MTLRPLLPVLVLLAAPVLAACGDDDGGSEDGGSSGATSESSDASTPTTPSTTAGTAPLPSACDVLTSDDVAAAYGVEFGDAEPGGGGYAEGDLEWQSDNCAWTAVELMEVKLALTGPDDFTAGAFTCPEPSAIAATVDPVDGLGDQAWWKVAESPPLETTLRVCTAEFIVEIDLEYEDGVDFVGDPQTQSVALAGVVLAKLA